MKLYKLVHIRIFFLFVSIINIVGILSIGDSAFAESSAAHVRSGSSMVSKNLLSSVVTDGIQSGVKSFEETMTKAKAKEAFVQKRVLSNGMTVLVREVHTIPKVSVQLFYNVGSKDEKTGEKGIAHLIEHMVFKGTKHLSETDIMATMHKLSGSCNAFTSYDYTGYTFTMPTQHWKEALPIMAECMMSCSFKDDHLNSEMKAVIQEMKMCKDQYVRHLLFEMLSLIFPDHPYHYPLIGHKQDLWNVRGKDLKAFYSKHYLPNNATLVIVGDVQAADVFDTVEKQFGAIPANKEYRKEQFYHNKDIVSKTMTIYRDVAQPVMLFAFVVPGAKDKNDHVLDAAELILGKGKGSRLYRKLVDELEIASYVSADTFRLFDYGVFFFIVEPKKWDDAQIIESYILQEIDGLIQKGATKEEIERAIKQTKMSYYSKLENVESQAYDIGKSFLAVGDENYPFTYLEQFSDTLLSDELKLLLSMYFRRSVMHVGMLLPLEEKEKAEWKKLQELSDQEDKNILYARVRETGLEPPQYTNNVQIKDVTLFDFPKPHSFELSNGLKVLFYNNKNTPKINLVLELRAKSFYDPDDMQGLYNFLANVMTEGTEHYSAVELANEIETRGMRLGVSPGYISMSMLREDLEKGLELLEEILCRPAFAKKEVEKVREQILIDIKNFWDDPASVASQLVRETIYKNHPYSKNSLGTKESVKKIRRTDLKKFYEQYISPHGAKLAVVGDLSGYDLQKVLEKKLVSWTGPQVQELEFPVLDFAKTGDIDYYMNRDQVVLSLATLSVARKHKDYDRLLLFDQIFGGGVLGGMHSRLFNLREATGMFYTIAGSSIANAGKQPGIALVRTIVSLDKIADAEKAIKETISNTADSITEAELDLAKRAIANALKDNFETNKKIAYAFLFLDEYGLPADYFDNRAAQIAQITLPEVKEAAKALMKAENMDILRVGRVGDQLA